MRKPGEKPSEIKTKRVCTTFRLRLFYKYQHYVLPEKLYSTHPEICFECIL